MKALNREAAMVMDALTGGLSEGNNYRKVNTSESFMAVVVEWIGYGNIDEQGDLFSVAHYYEQNGDLMRDPEMIFYRAGAGAWFPTYFRQDNMGIEWESVVFEADGKVKDYRKRMQADQAAFANIWMRNIKEQQNLLSIKQSSLFGAQAAA